MNSLAMKQINNYFEFENNKSDNFNLIETNNTLSLSTNSHHDKSIALHETIADI